MIDHLWYEKIEKAEDLATLEALRINILGKTGILTQELKALSSCSEEERRQKGVYLNEAKKEIAQLIQNKKKILESAQQDKRLAEEVLDITLQTQSKRIGKLHPITFIQEHILKFFYRLGFVFQDGPELEDEFHNFDALNVPIHHPARQSQDTFYAANRLLRSHTTTVQIRSLEKLKPPLRIISVGRVYRSDSLDATHTPMFHQFEGIVIEPKIHMGHLKGVLLDFCKFFFDKEDIPFRFRPSFFPFTEPSAELDLAFAKGDWLEILGCGMIHPNVLKQCGLDPQEHQGFAFGGGVERLLMLKYGICDIRHLYTNDYGWLQHYGSYPFEV